ncbi:ImmA/IrrE family metallo-endopeptidase [Bacillus toyonensis]|uniref:ImmA/IrrE family metallo-endopeptidase n=1 Tax=Bacillus toyonensis TaxID=155322 RepID=UPI000BF9FD7A|nr:ImmA/IrrE family metallo-endopeptidase [Bacillus toyonensis]PGB95011.1 toxin [Bacillus toyonensis]
MYIKQYINLKIQELITKHETRDPFKIANILGIVVLFEELGDIYGYYNKVSRIPFIHINKKLSETMQRFTFLHELGHALLHPNENTPKLSAVSLHSEMRIEFEANYFATRFLIDGRHHDYNLRTKHQVLRFYGIPKEMERFI